MFREPRSLDWNVYVNNLMHFVFVHIIACTLCSNGMYGNFKHTDASSVS